MATPIVEIVYDTKDITSDFLPLLKSVTYKDSIEGKASSIDITLRDDTQLFLGSWYPKVDDTIQLKIGYKEGSLLNCGSFWVDEVTLNGSSSGSECTISAMSLKGADILGSRNIKAHQNKPIKDIVNDISKRLNMTANGNLEGMYNGFQENESDLAFLNRLAKETNRLLKIEGQTLIFYKLNDLKQSEALLISRDDVKSYDIKDVAYGRLKSVTCVWWNNEKKTEFKGVYTLPKESGADIVIREEVASDSEALQKATDYANERGKDKYQITLSMIGNTRLKAGVKVILKDFSRFDGEYYIAEVTHKIGGGYTTDLILKQWLK